MADVRSLTRHHTYYIPSADLSFLLGHVQFRVHRYFFERESPFFKGKLTTPMSPGAVRQGSSDADPLVLEDVRAEDFERFLWVFYNPRYSLYDAKVDDWSVILSLAHRWGFAEVKSLAVRELEKKEFSSIDRIVYYQSNDVDRNLLIPHYAAVCAREHPLTLAEGIKLGMETTLVIASAREYIRAIPTRDGLRSPVTPTVDGEELHDMIRELFNIPAVRKLEGSPTKDDPKPSSSSGGLPTKPQPTTSHPPPTQAAPFSPPPRPLQQKKPPVPEAPLTPTPAPKRAHAPEVRMLQTASLPPLTVPSTPPPPAQPVKEEAKPTESAPPPTSTETVPPPTGAPLTEASQMDPPQTPLTPTKSSAAQRKAGRREKLRLAKLKKETEGTGDKPTADPSQATQESDPKGIDEPESKVELQAGKEEEQVEVGGEKVEAVASGEKQDEVVVGVEGGGEKPKEVEVKAEEAKEAGSSSPAEAEAGDGKVEEMTNKAEVEEPKAEKPEKLQAETKTETPGESSMAEEGPKVEKLDAPTQEEPVKETEVENLANETKQEELVQEPVAEVKAEEPVVETKAKDPAVETKPEEPAVETVEEPVVETNMEEPAVELKSEELVSETKAEEPIAALKDQLNGEKQESTEAEIDGSVTQAKVEDSLTEVVPSAEPQPEEAANADKGSEPSATEQVNPSEGEGLTVQTAPALTDVKADDTEGIDSPVVGPEEKKARRKADKAARKKARKLAEEKAAVAAQETNAEGAKPSEEPTPEATPNTPAQRAAKLEPIKTQGLPQTESLIDVSATPSSAFQQPPLPPKPNATSPTTTRGARPPLSERLSKQAPSAWPPTPSATNGGWSSSSPSSAKPKKEENAAMKIISSLWS